jgi:transposase
VVYPIAVGGEKAQDGGMPEKAQRRRFTAAYKLKVLAEAAGCRQPGELGALLRREGLYSSHLAAWRAARRRGELAGLATRRGPPRRAPDPQAARVVQLERQLAAAIKRAERAEAIVEVQKKVAALLGTPLPPTAPS